MLVITKFTAVTKVRVSSSPRFSDSMRLSRCTNVTIDIKLDPRHSAAVLIMRPVKNTICFFAPGTFDMCCGFDTARCWLHARIASWMCFRCPLNSSCWVREGEGWGVIGWGWKFTFSLPLSFPVWRRTLTTMLTVLIITTPRASVCGITSSSVG